MLNVIPIAVLVLFVVAATVLYARRRAPFSFVILAGGLGLLSDAAWPFWPVDAKEQGYAVTLAHAGAHGAEAYRAATADGEITHSEMRALRDAAGRDIDEYYGLTRPDHR